MLVLARKVNQSIMLGDQIEIIVVDVQGDQVKLGIRAPRDVKIFRKEIYEEIQKENIRAAQTTDKSLEKLGDLFSKNKQNPENK